MSNLAFVDKTIYNKPRQIPCDTLIYNFGDNTADGGAELKHLLGGKGANLGEMSRLGLPDLQDSHHHQGLLEVSLPTMVRRSMKRRKCKSW